MLFVDEKKKTETSIADAVDNSSHCKVGKGKFKILQSAFTQPMFCWSSILVEVDKLVANNRNSVIRDEVPRVVCNIEKSLAKMRAPQVYGRNVNAIEVAS